MQAAGAEQTRQASDGSTIEAAARSAEELVAEGNKAQLQAEIDALKSKHAAELEAIQANHTSVSTVTSGTPDGARSVAGAGDAGSDSKRQKLSDETPALKDNP